MSLKHRETEAQRIEEFDFNQVDGVVISTKEISLKFEIVNV